MTYIVLQSFILLPSADHPMMPNSESLVGGLWTLRDLNFVAHRASIKQCLSQVILFGLLVPFVQHRSSSHRVQCRSQAAHWTMTCVAPRLRKLRLAHVVVHFPPIAQWSEQTRNATSYICCIQGKRCAMFVVTTHGECSLPLPCYSSWMPSCTWHIDPLQTLPYFKHHCEVLPKVWVRSSKSYPLNTESFPFRQF